MTKTIWLGAIIVAILFGGWFFLGSNAPSIGGSTADSWNVGGNLSVDGTSAFTGASTFTGAITASDLGVASTTLTFDANFGSGGATTTVGGGYFCQYWQIEDGTGVYITLDPTGAEVFATSSTACN